MTSHCFGEPGMQKLIVSVSFGTQAVSKWKGKSCSDGEASSCCLGHGDILVMDGQCQDEFRHCTDPCREQERTNITFRWIKQHVSSCRLFMAGVACCLPTCAQGSSVPVMENAVFGVFWAFWFLLGALCIWGVLVLLVSLLGTRLGLHRCAFCWTRPLSGGRWEHHLCNLWGEYLKVHKTAYMNLGICGYIMDRKPYMLALVGRPSLHGYDACMVYLNKGALRRNCRQKYCKTSFSPFWVFLFGRNSRERFWGLILWHFGVGRATHPGPPLPVLSCRC